MSLQKIEEIRKYREMIRPGRIDPQKKKKESLQTVTEGKPKKEAPAFILSDIIKPKEVDFY